jgi:hypothetical protein
MKSLELIPKKELLCPQFESYKLESLQDPSHQVQHDILPQLPATPYSLTGHDVFDSTVGNRFGIVSARLQFNNLLVIDMESQCNFTIVYLDSNWCLNFMNEKVRKPCLRLQPSCDSLLFLFTAIKFLNRNTNKTLNSYIFRVSLNQLSQLPCLLFPMP